MPPASASRAGVTPEASRDRSSGTLANEKHTRMKPLLLLLVVIAGLAVYYFYPKKPTEELLPPGIACITKPYKIETETGLTVLRRGLQVKVMEEKSDSSLITTDFGHFEIPNDFLTRVASEANSAFQESETAKRVSAEARLADMQKQKEARKDELDHILSDISGVEASIANTERNLRSMGGSPLDGRNLDRKKLSDQIALLQRNLRMKQERALNIAKELNIALTFNNRGSLPSHGSQSVQEIDESNLEPVGRRHSGRASVGGAMGE